MTTLIRCTEFALILHLGSLCFFLWQPGGLLLPGEILVLHLERSNSLLGSSDLRQKRPLQVQ
jgi:hypothetical protein